MPSNDNVFKMFKYQFDVSKQFISNLLQIIILFKLV